MGTTGVSVTKPGVLLINFGGPQSEAELAPFLEELFLDVLPLPGFAKHYIARRVARSRAARVAPSYAMIGWSPLVPSTFDQAQALRAELGELPLAVGMMLSPPSLASGLQDLVDQGVDGVVALALFPQWSFATSGAAFDRLDDALAEIGQPDLPLHRVPPFYGQSDYVKALADTIQTGVSTLSGEGPIHLLFSPHGLPLSFLRKGDPYPEQVRATIKLVLEALGWTDPAHVGWQSRVGPVKWMEPSTESEVQRLGREGAERVLVVSVAFVGDHIETLHEIDIELAAEAERAGIRHFGRSPALHTHPDFIRCLSRLALDGVTRFGTSSCVRCTLPITPGYVAGRCAKCRFTPPQHLQG